MRDEVSVAPGVMAPPSSMTNGEPRLLAWTTVLADVVRSDRGETVGGTVHPRPAAPVR